MAENKVGFKPTAVNPMGLSALIRNLGRDCTPDQFIREFVKNSIEACQRTGIAEREILLDYNHGIVEKSGLFKLSFIDNGDGMTLEQMENLLNNLSASGPQQNEHQNYGVGAKIASLTRNHFGVHYESWKNNQGHAILIRYNPKFDVFGIQGYPDENGDIFYSRKLSDDQKPNCVSEHGTCVTLFGMNLEHDTMSPPDGMPGDKSAWLLNYLNRRFFSIPKGIQLRVRVGYDQDKSNPALHFLATVKGFRSKADDNSQSKGVMELRDATAHWWILKPNAELNGQSGLLNQEELFDLQGDRSNRLTLFGILLGRDRVIILIEPKEAVQNTSRTSLKKPDGNELKWNTWQDEFRAKLPLPIVEFMNSLLSDYGLTQSRQIYTRLMSLAQLYQISGYKTLKVNLLRGDIKKPLFESEKSSPVELKNVDFSIPQSPEETTLPESNLDNQLNPSTESKENELNEPKEEIFPAVEWSDEGNSKQLIGRAAEYIEFSGVILANQDFIGFKDLVNYFTEKFPGSEKQVLLIKRSVLEIAEQALMETVAGILSMRGKPHWNEGQIMSALSKESLTATVMQRYWGVKHIEDQILGQLNQTEVAKKLINT